MIPNKGIDDLADEMDRRRGEVGRPCPDTDEPGRQPFVLFLGPECAVAAGVPGKEQIARQLLDLISGDEDLAALLSPPTQERLAHVAELSSVKLLPIFYEVMDELAKKRAGGKIHRMFLNFYANVPVPLFYQDLGLLIKAGYFERILTTNIDTLLEQGLDLVGLEARRHYQVTSLGVAPGDDASGGYDDAPGDDEPAGPRQVIKLFGDLSKGQVNISPGDINNALRSQRRYVKSELEGDIVMVGYNFESRPINEWLKFGGGRRQQLWWVSGDGPPTGGEDLIEDWAERVQYITGPVGSPQEFFGQLKLRLLRRPSLQSLGETGYGGRRRRRRSPSQNDNDEGFESLASKSFGIAHGADPDESAEESAGANGMVAPPPVAPEEAGLIEDLRGNILRSRALLSSLEQTAPPGDLPSNLRAQAAYQKQQIAEMEDKIRSLAGSRREITKAFEVIVGEVQRACADGVGEGTGRAADDAAMAFMRSQQQAVLDQYDRAEPNHFVVAAAIGAAVMMAERMCVEPGHDVVKPEHVRRLAAFAPSVAGRGII